MKKRYVILIGVLALAALTAVGCGKKESDTDTQDAQVTATPAADSTQTDTEDSGDLIDMQESTEEEISNVMGEETDTATKVIFVNGTGSDIARLYVRAHVDDGDDSEWGDDLIQDRFTLANGEKALYYFDASAKDSDGNVPSSYDIRIIYTDEDLSECYFRDIPLQNITQITLRMDGTGEDSIPYATYTQGSSKQEISTLAAVKKRLGLDDESGETETEEESTSAPETEETPTTAAEETTAPTTESTDDNGDTEPTDSGAETAKTYIGQSLDALIAACGEPSASDYQDEPETGETGYHYYSTFTVSTSVDEDGNEIVAGVW